MKKILKLFLIVALFILILVNYCYATNNMSETLDVNVVPDETVIDGALDTLYNTNQDDGIMPINDISDLDENNDTVENDVFLLEQNVNFNKNINGNMYVMGRNVNVSLQYINGNIFVMGENVKISGYVNGSIYVFAKDVTIDTQSVNTIYAFGSKLELLKNANIMNDVNAFLKDLNIDGNIYRNLNAFTENINITGNAQYIGTGNVEYTGQYTDNNEKLANVNLKKVEKNKENTEEVKGIINLALIKAKFVKVISTVLIIAVIYFITKNRNSEKTEEYISVVGKDILTGLLWIILVPIAFIILLITVIGIPLSMIILTIYILALCISIPVAVLRISEMIFDKTTQSNKWMILLYAICVYVVIELISLIPIVGGLVRFLLVLFGVGSIIKYIFKLRQKSSDKQKDEIIVNE